MEVWGWWSGIILNHTSHLLYSGRLSRSSLELPDMASLISQRALETPISTFWGCNYRFTGLSKDLNSGPHACCSKHIRHGAIYPDSPPYFLRQGFCLDLGLADLHRLTRQQAPGIPVFTLHFPSTRIRHAWHCACFFFFKCGHWGLNSSLHVSHSKPSTNWAVSLVLMRCLQERSDNITEVGFPMWRRLLGVLDHPSFPSCWDRHRGKVQHNVYR